MNTDSTTSCPNCNAAKAESEEIYRHLEHCRIERDALRAQLAEVQEDLEDEQDSGDSAYAADAKRIYEIRELTAERDALAVTAERQAEQIRRLRESLRPFEYQARIIDENDVADGFGPEDDCKLFQYRGSYTAISLGDCRKALAILKETAP